MVIWLNHSHMISQQLIIFMYKFVWAKEIKKLENLKNRFISNRKMRVIEILNEVSLIDPYLQKQF